MNTIVTKSLEDTKKAAAEWLSSISNAYASRDEALVVGLSGHLGAGKTAFVKELAALLGIREDVTSPTFVIMKIYELRAASDKPQVKAPWKRLIHIDAYRFERREELQALEWERLVADKNNLILVEWPENVGMKEFEPGAQLYFEASAQERTISIK